MADLNPRNMAWLRQDNPRLFDLITDVVSGQNNVALQTNAAPVGVNPPPPAHSALSVKGGAGIYDVAVMDNNPKYRGAENFFEYSQDQGFANAHVRPMGASRNWRGSLGKGPFFFRSYSAHPTTGASEHTYQPGSVDGSGADEPPMQPGQGSGTSTVAGHGFGATPFTGDKRPIR